MAELRSWTVYKHPRDFPDNYVARLFINERATGLIILSNKLQDVRDQLPANLIVFPRVENDDPCIVEVWV